MGGCHQLQYEQEVAIKGNENQHNIVKQLSSNLKKGKEEIWGKDETVLYFNCGGYTFMHLSKLLKLKSKNFTVCKYISSPPHPSIERHVHEKYHTIAHTYTNTHPPLFLGTP